MSDKVIDIHGMYESPNKGTATPQGEMLNFCKLLDEQLKRDGDPESMVMFGATRGALHRIRAAMQCGVQALDVQDAIKASS